MRLFTAVYWRRLTKWGAIAIVLATNVSWGYHFRDSIWTAGYTLQPVVPTFAGSMVPLVVLTLITPPPPHETLRTLYPDV
jgi:SSS family solute:Na+ symporter